MIKSLMLLPMFMNLMMIILLMIPTKLIKLHPLSFLIILISTTFMITMKMNFIYKSWLSFILFLIMIGGLLVIFMYITSLTNNNFFFFNLKMIIMNLFKTFLMILLIFIMYMLLNESIYFNLNLNYSFLNNYLFMWEQNNMNFLYKKFYNKSTIFIMLYLYYSMIIIMNICSNYKSPLRQNLF